MSQIQERGSTHVYKVNKISKEEVDSMVSRCVYENPPFCSAACPLKLDVRAMLKARTFAYWFAITSSPARRRR